MVNGFCSVDNTVTVIIILTGAVFVVVVPLSIDQTGIVHSTLEPVQRHDSVVTRVDASILVNGVEGVCVVLEVEGDEIAAHRCQVNVWNNQRFVGPCIVIAVGRGVTGMTEPVGVVVEDICRTGVFVVDGALRLQSVSLLGVAITLATSFKRFLTNSRRSATVNVGRCCGVNCCFNTKVNWGITVVVGGDADVKGTFSIEPTWLEEINRFNSWVVEIERRHITSGVVVNWLFIPSIARQRSRNTIGRVVEQVCLNRSGVFLTGLKVRQRTDGRRLKLWIGEEGRVLLPDGEVVNSKAVSATPTAFIVVCR